MTEDIVLFTDEEELAANGPLHPDVVDHDSNTCGCCCTFCIPDEE